MEKNKRTAIFAELKTAYHKEHDYIEITEWTNKEGYDIDISGKEKISFHFTEWNLIKKIMQKFENVEQKH